MAITFEDFLETVPEENQAFVITFHKDLTSKGCTIEIKSAKSGHVVSYKYNKKTIMNWVFRKSGLVGRIYGDNVGAYSQLLGNLPEPMKATMRKSSNCRRLLDPTACISTCVMGLVYELDDENYQKCRYSAMQFPLNDISGEHIQALVNAEFAVRSANPSA